MGKQRVAVVVDPYSSGKFLLPEFQRRQIPMVGIRSSLDLAQFWLDQYNEDFFIKNIDFESVEQIMKELEEFEVCAVAPGSEPGVLLAEDLIDRYGLPGNKASTKNWRRDKYAMQERLRECNIRATEQLQSANLQESLEWCKKRDKWPVIVKPPMSGGTDGVYWCHSEADVENAFKKTHGVRNVNGVVNDVLLIQEFLDGTEYIIDCVSYEGKHVLSGIWVYSKKKDSERKCIIYDYAKLLPSTGEVQDQLVEYTFKCLTALGIEYGPSHTEVMMVADGPCLIETGARMHGLKGPKLLEECTGFGTHELAVDILFGAELFHQLYRANHKYFIKRWAFEVIMKNEIKVGTLKSPITIPADLPSVQELFPSVLPGQEIPLTIDLATSPGVATLMHVSLDQCMADIKKIQALEKTTLFDIEPYETNGDMQRQVSPRSPLIGCGSALTMTSPDHAGPIGQADKPATFALGGYPTGFSLDGTTPTSSPKQRLDVGMTGFS